MSLLALTLVCLWAPSLSAQELVVAPFLQDATPTSIWIAWETSEGEESRVDWGPTEALEHTTTGHAHAGSLGSRIHETQITDLTPDTRYAYRVTTGTAQSGISHFRTPPPLDAETSFRFVGMSDMQRDPLNPDVFAEIVQDGVLGWVDEELGGDIADAVGFIIVPGDLVDDGRNYSEWGRTFFAPGAPLFGRVPVYPVLGNHENDTDFYFNYFHLPANGTPGFEEHWWYTDYANLRVVGLDSNSGYRNQTQLGWLEDVLQESCFDDRIDFLFVQLHHPHLSELWLDGEIDYTGEVVRRLEDFTAECGKPSIHFFGHTHGYSRGQSRDHSHLWVNVATAGGNIDHWGEYGQRDYDEFTVSQDEYGFVLVEVEGGSDPGFGLQRIGRGDERAPADNVVRDEIRVRRFNTPPGTPVPTAPEDTVDPDCAWISASAFADPDGDLQGAAHWQVSASCEDFSELVVDAWRQHENWFGDVDLQSGDRLRDERLSALQPESDYCFRVRYRDRGLAWSEWSEPMPFRTAPSGSLLLNPGAEEGTSGWTEDSPFLESLTAGQCDGISPHNGTHYFSSGGLCDSTGYGEAHQRVALSGPFDAVDVGDLQAVFSGFLANYNGSDRPEIGLVFRDEAGGEIDRTELLGHQTPAWTRVEGRADVPPGTRSIDFLLVGTRNAGADNDSYFDDLALVLVDGEEEPCAPPDLEEPPSAEEPADIAEPMGEDGGGARDAGMQDSATSDGPSVGPPDADGQGTPAVQDAELTVDPSMAGQAEAGVSTTEGSDGCGCSQPRLDAGNGAAVWLALCMAACVRRRRGQSS